MARRSDHNREELKELILSSAAQIIENEGSQGLTARKIAKDIGYTPGTLYNVFPSMDGIIITLNAQTLDALLAALNDELCINPKKSPLSNMKTMARTYHQFAEDNSQRWLLLFSHQLPDGEEVPDWMREKIYGLFQPLENLLEPYFTNRQSKARTLAARSLWASIHGMCFLHSTGKLPLVHDKDPLSPMTDTLIENFVAGLEKN